MGFNFPMLAKSGRVAGEAEMRTISGTSGAKSCKPHQRAGKGQTFISSASCTLGSFFFFFSCSGKRRRGYGEPRELVLFPPWGKCKSRFAPSSRMHHVAASRPGFMATSTNKCTRRARQNPVEAPATDKSGLQPTNCHVDQPKKGCWAGLAFLCIPLSPLPRPPSLDFFFFLSALISCQPASSLW